MKWQKLGRVFNPNEHALANGCQEFAQAPQALLCDGFIRVFFSTRTLDTRNNKYLSHIAFVDMRKDFGEIIRVSDKTVIPLGEMGCFDEHGIFPMNVVRHGDAVLGYTCGWSRRVSVSIETSIGLAISHDNGATFQRIGAGPILSSSLHEPFLVGDGFVKVIGNTFHMWYIFGTAWKTSALATQPDRTYKIGHAVSKDGFNWTKDEARQIISSRLGEGESQALPTVVRIGDVYHMFFCYRQSVDFRTNSSRAYRIGHAFSEDLNHWTRDDELLPLMGDPGEWDADMQCYPHAFECDGRVYMLYNGNEFGRFGFGAAVLTV
jgi:hypothetical protein